MVIYFDIETLIRPVGKKNHSLGKNTSKRVIKYKHFPLAIAAKRICASSSEYNSPLFLSIGEENCVDDFLTFLDEQAQEIEMIFRECQVPVEMTSADWDVFHRQTHCHICQREFSKSIGKVVDHCHISGSYR